MSENMGATWTPLIGALNVHKGKCLQCCMCDQWCHQREGRNIARFKSSALTYI